MESNDDRSGAGLRAGFFPHSCSLVPLPQANLRKSSEDSMSLMEKDKIMLQHRFTEYQRKADQDAEKRRNLENEGKDNEGAADVRFRHAAIKV